MSVTFLQHVLRAVPVVIVCLAGVLLVAAVGLFGFRTLYEGRIYPAVVVGDVAVGGLTVAEADAELAARAAELEAGTITFRYGEQVWTPTLAELGVTVDLESSLATASALGRSGDAAARLGVARELLQADQVVPLRTVVDTAQLGVWFDGVDRDLGQPAVNAQVVVDGLEVVITPEAAGVQVDRDAALAAIVGSLEGLTVVSVPLPTEPAQPEITAADIAEVHGQVVDLVGRAVRITFEERTWRMDGERLVPYLIVENVVVDGEPDVRLSIDVEHLAIDLRTQFAPEINRRPVEAEVRWDNAVGLVATSRSLNGVTVRAGALAQEVADSFLGEETPVSIPVVVIRPTVDSQNLGALGITSRLGSGDSNFAGGNWARDENVRIGTRLMNGTLVPPGGTFSFNGAVGEITYAKGFQDALVVVGEQIGRDVGGGICQVSTTVFRAAINAGMPIVEWHPHSFRLPNYERDGWGAGFDASILQMGSNPNSWADFRFENFTDGWLLVEAYVDFPRMVVSIYGTDTGRSVKVSSWESSSKHVGFTRTIFDADGAVVARRTFATHFK